MCFPFPFRFHLWRKMAAIFCFHFCFRSKKNFHLCCHFCFWLKNVKIVYSRSRHVLVFKDCPSIKSRKKFKKPQSLVGTLKTAHNSLYTNSWNGNMHNTRNSSLMCYQWQCPQHYLWSSLPKPDIIILVIMVIRVGNPTNKQKTISSCYWHASQYMISFNEGHITSKIWHNDHQNAASSSS